MIPLSPWLDPMHEWVRADRQGVDLCWFYRQDGYWPWMLHDGWHFGPTWQLLDWLGWRRLTEADARMGPIVERCMGEINSVEKIEGYVAYAIGTLGDPLAATAVLVTAGVWLCRRERREGASMPESTPPLEQRIRQWMAGSANWLLGAVVAIIIAFGSGIFEFRRHGGLALQNDRDLLDLLGLWLIGYVLVLLARRFWRAA